MFWLLFFYGPTEPPATVTGRDPDSPAPRNSPWRCFSPKFLGWKFENRKTTTFLKPRMSWKFTQKFFHIKSWIYSGIPVSLGPPCLCHLVSSRLAFESRPKPIRSGLLLMRYFMISKDPSKVARCKGVTPWPGGCIGCICIPRHPHAMPRMIHPQIDEPVVHSHQICVLPLAFWMFHFQNHDLNFKKNPWSPFLWIWWSFTTLLSLSSGEARFFSNNFTSSACCAWPASRRKNDVEPLPRCSSPPVGLDGLGKNWYRILKSASRPVGHQMFRVWLDWKSWGKNDPMIVATYNCIKSLYE